MHVQHDRRVVLEGCAIILWGRITLLSRRKWNKVAVTIRVSSHVQNKLNNCISLDVRHVQWHSFSSSELWFSLSPRQPLCLFLIASSLLTSALSIATGSLWRRALQISNKTLRINSSKMVQNKLKNSWIVNNMVLRRMISNQNKLA